MNKYIYLLNPNNPLGRHSGVGRNPVEQNRPRSGQKQQDVVPLTWGFFHYLDSGLRRNDVISANGQSGLNRIHSVICNFSCFSCLSWTKFLTNIINKTIFIGLFLSAGAASAAEYNQLQQAQSTLTFGYKQMGVPMEGKFGQFAAQLSFDPAKFAGAQAHIDVALSSIDTGLRDANESIAGKLWFNTGLYPLGSFVSTGVKALGGNRYQVTGKLTLKGQTREVSAPVTFKTDGNQGSFDGSFNIKRLDYGIGVGEWTDLDTVADDVQIVFHFKVLAAPVTPSLTQPPRKKP